MIEDSLSDLDCNIYIYQPSDHIVERLKSERVKLTPARAMTLDVLGDLVAYGSLFLFLRLKRLSISYRSSEQKMFSKLNTYHIFMDLIPKEK